MDSLALSSKGSCTLFQAATSSAADGITRDRPVREGSSFRFTAESFAGPFWLECSQAVTLLREGMSSSSYEGHFFLKRVVPASGRPYLTVVNLLDLETYLKGVVPAEMSVSWPAEALKAQAVAARTYALFQLAGDKDNEDPRIVEERSGAQIDDTVFFQAYQGLDRRAASSDAAVEKTRGLAMLQGGRLIKAYFHSDSGGHTEDSANAFGIPLPYCIGRPEIYPEGSVPESLWELRLSLAEASQKLRAARLLPPGDSATAFSVAPADVLPSGRPLRVTLHRKGGAFAKVSPRDFRFALGLKSAWVRFASSKGGGEVLILGRGKGHGVGMSQWGARVMAEKLGKDFRQILAFYYTGIELKYRR